jgi:hypothetical protein
MRAIFGPLVVVLAIVGQAAASEVAPADVAKRFYQLANEGSVPRRELFSPPKRSAFSIARSVRTGSRRSALQRPARRRSPRLRQEASRGVPNSDREHHEDLQGRRDGP